MTQDINLVLGGRFLPTQTIDYLAEIGISTYLTQLRFVCSSTAAPSILNDSTNPFWNFYQEALVGAIREHPLARKR